MHPELQIVAGEINKSLVTLQNINISLAHISANSPALTQLGIMQNSLYTCLERISQMDDISTGVVLENPMNIFDGAIRSLKNETKN